MGSETDDLRRRLERLEQRVAELEDAAVSRLVSPTPVPVVTAEPVHRPVPAPSAPLPPPPAPRPVPAQLGPELLVPDPLFDDSWRATPVPPPAARPARNLERFVGGKFYAAVGAVVVVVGVGMFLKLAVERGWFRFPPSARCAAAAGFGLLLLLGGEWARRKISAVASVGLSAAGIATTYAAVVAAFGWYKLMGAAPALAMLAAVSALGVVVALRAGQALLAWIALVAAYVTPLVLWKSGMSVLVTPLYLLAVLGFALTLAARRPRPFGSVRGVAWWGTVLIGTFWSLGAADRNAALVAGFVLVVWAAVHAEMAVSAPADDRVARHWWRRAMLSVGSTTWAGLIGSLAAHFSRVGWTPEGWMITGAMFVAACGLAHLLSGYLGGMMDRPETQRQRLGAVLWLESGALLIATVALGIDGSSEAVCWLVLGVAAVAAARWIGARPLAVYGLVVLTIAVGRLLLWESWHGGAGTLALGVYLNRWTALTAGAVAGLAACAVLLRVRAWTPAWVNHSNVCTGAACVLAIAGAVHEESEPLAIAAWATLVCGVIWGLAWRLRSVGLGVLAGVGTAAVLALASGAQNSGLDRLRSDRVLGLVLGPWSVVIAMIAGVWGLGAWVCAGWSSRRAAAVGEAVVGCAIGGGLAMMLIPDVPTSDGSSLIVYWSIIAAVLMVAHAAWRRTLPAGLGLAALAVAAAGWVYYFPLLGWRETTAPVLLHPGLWLAVLLSGLGWGAEAWLRREGTDAGNARLALVRMRVIAAAIGLLLFTATSLEVARLSQRLFATDQTSQNAAVSIWWGLFAMVLLGIGFARRVAVVRHIGLGLLGLATAKAIMVDLREVSPEWRVASFIGLGLLMLAVAVVYARANRRLSEDRPVLSEGLF
jgi:uncharacterized membrane protein